jgi:hypothetical protein
VNLDAVYALRGERNRNCHKLHILLWDRAVGECCFVVGPNAFVASGAFFANFGNFLRSFMEYEIPSPCRQVGDIKPDTGY